MFNKKILLIIMCLLMGTMCVACGSMDFDVEMPQTTPYANDSMPRHKVGDVFESSGFKFSYLSFEKVEVFDDIPAEDGMEYYVYELELENVSDREKHAHYGSFVCYADDVLTTQIYGYDDILKGTLIEKGNKARGTVVFLVPKDAELVELLFQYNMEDERLVFAVD